MSRLVIHVDELVLEGFSSAEAHRVAAAVERELARLLAEQDLPAVWTRSSEIQRLDAGRVQLRPSGAEQAGVRIARALDQSFRR